MSEKKPVQTDARHKLKHNVTLDPNMSLAEALRILESSRAGSAAITREGKVIGHLAARSSTIGLEEPERTGVPPEMESDLRLAKKIQQQLLPRAIPTIPGLDVYGTLISATAVGGDYWSVKYYRADNRVTLKLADVTGHGVAAALLVPAVKYISGGFYRGAPSPEWVMQRTNHVLVEETPVEILVTMAYAWYSVTDRSLRVVNAGHRPAFLVKDGTVIEVPATGPVLGLLETDYESQTFELSPGDVYFACSDGITEAGRGSDRFGDERVMEVVRKASAGSAREIADAVLVACRAFSSNIQDDRSILVAVARPTGETRLRSRPRSSRR
ncbi:MAG: SpoIIE family protein phosphatase [Chloroflexi bacterium]|nr:SpoIIE family protein phosphatase [Chloroflexota bacterium]